MTARLGILLVLAAPLLAVAGASRAEPLWVKDELILNVRSGPGNEYPVLGTLRTGDAAEVLTREGKWTEVRSHISPKGWIISGYLQPETPASQQLERRTEELSKLRARAVVLEQQVNELRSQGEEIARREAEQKQEIERLARASHQLEEGPRWPEWIAGASILAVGGVFGSMLRRGGQRSASRIRI